MSMDAESIYQEYMELQSDVVKHMLSCLVCQAAYNTIVKHTLNLQKDKTALNQYIKIQKDKIAQTDIVEQWENFGKGE